MTGDYLEIMQVTKKKSFWKAWPRHQWVMPVILATWETEVWRIAVWD
jgi:hypothetical protein